MFFLQINFSYVKSIFTFIYKPMTGSIYQTRGKSEFQARLLKAAYCSMKQFEHSREAQAGTTLPLTTVCN